MVQKTQTTFTPLLVAIIIIICALLPLNAPQFGISTLSPFSNRLTYMWVHSNIFHAIINGWCLLAVTAVYRLRNLALITAIAIAASCPDMWLTETPTIGLSGVCFALMGLASLKSARPVRFNFYALSFLAIGFLFPHVASWLHLYCYLSGIVAGCISYLIRRCWQR